MSNSPKKCDDGRAESWSRWSVLLSCTAARDGPTQTPLYLQKSFKTNLFQLHNYYVSLSELIYPPFFLKKKLCC